MVGHCQTSDTYSDFIKSHLESLKIKCGQFSACIDKLLAEVSVTVLLSGDNISLNKTCGLIHKNSLGSYSTLKGNCTPSEREDIRGYIETHVGDVYETRSEWKSLRKCLELEYVGQDMSDRVEAICGLAQKHKEICNSSNIHNIMETFFNEQIQSLQCTCKNLELIVEDTIPLPVWVAAGVCGLLLLIAIFTACYFWRRSRTLKKRESKRTDYTQGHNSDVPVYQEVYDDSNFQPILAATPPSLPLRYVTSPPASFGKEPHTDESGYLEPANVGFIYRPKPPAPRESPDSPPTYSQCERDAEENGYFNPLPSPTDGVDGGFKPPEHNKNTTDGDTDQKLSSPVEQVSKQKPSPAKRTNIADKKTESHYFVLEKEPDIS
ncbi:uncharacterized protein LOC131927847 [Physella acuta]|uniref:uncharacterized protein LOC131927847 n=1 Tax=Physella acuta TaxID=109671 RepID=UPI0027DBBD58|nr:uncharacterized protein LOC131927847 [Physella acuta]